MELSNRELGTKLNIGLDDLIKSDYNALLGLETATEYWGLSTFNSIKPIILFNDNNVDNNGISVDLALEIVFVPNVNSDNVVHLSEHLAITDKEQTVVDMVRYNRHEFHLYETLISAIDEKQVDIERLNNLAERYGVYDRMYELYALALIAEQEDNE